jgi:para-nitrobenzyl esterase
MFKAMLSGSGCRTAVAMLVCMALSLALHGGAAAQGCTPYASPPAGSMCGVDTTIVYSTGTGTDTAVVSVFAGIPYADSITSNGNAGRWRPPTPLAPWSDTLQATQPGSICPQMVYDSTTTQQDTTIAGDEDCLFLNVWQPPTASDSSALPVMVFIHGGTFIAGAGSLGSYDGGYLAASGNVVVVTINYRLGALGWLTTDSIPTNLGLRDQQLALQWVQANIGAFGGDPSQVTIFGESAGAMSVGLHLFSVPTSAPLFRAAIMESNLMAFPYRDTIEAQADGASFLGQLCTQTGAKDCPVTMSWLQGLTTDQIMIADTTFQGSTVYNRIAAYGLPEIIPWSPVMDGTLVTGQPMEGYAAGMQAKPYVFGMNFEEGVLFADLVAAAINPGWQTAKYDSLMGMLYGGQENRISNFMVRKSGIFPYSSVYVDPLPPLDPLETALSNVLNDGLFHCGNLAAADAALVMNQPDSLPVFGYLFLQPPVFNHPPPEIIPCKPQFGNVCHTYELPYVFNNFAYWQGQPGSGQPAAADSALAQSMSAAWTNFATTLSTPAPGWQQYTPNGGLFVWGTSSETSNGTIPTPMVSGWSEARNCTQLWNGVTPRGG